MRVVVQNGKSYLLSFTALFTGKEYTLNYNLHTSGEVHTEYVLSTPVYSRYDSLVMHDRKEGRKFKEIKGLLNPDYREAEIPFVDGHTPETISSGEIVAYLSHLSEFFHSELYAKESYLSESETTEHSKRDAVTAEDQPTYFAQKNIEIQDITVPKYLLPDLDITIHDSTVTEQTAKSIEIVESTEGNQLAKSIEILESTDPVNITRLEIPEADYQEAVNTVRLLKIIYGSDIERLIIKEFDRVFSIDLQESSPTTRLEHMESVITEFTDAPIVRELEMEYSNIESSEKLFDIDDFKTVIESAEKTFSTNNFLEGLDKADRFMTHENTEPAIEKAEKTFSEVVVINNGPEQSEKTLTEVVVIDNGPELSNRLFGGEGIYYTPDTANKNMTWQGEVLQSEDTAKLVTQVLDSFVDSDWVTALPLDVLWDGVYEKGDVSFKPDITLDGVFMGPETAVYNEIILNGTQVHTETSNLLSMPLEGVYETPELSTFISETLEGIVEPPQDTASKSMLFDGLIEPPQDTAVKDMTFEGVIEPSTDEAVIDKNLEARLDEPDTALPNLTLDAVYEKQDKAVIEMVEDAVLESGDAAIFKESVMEGSYIEYNTVELSVFTIDGQMEQLTQAQEITTTVDSVLTLPAEALPFIQTMDGVFEETELSTQVVSIEESHGIDIESAVRKKKKRRTKIADHDLGVLIPWKPPWEDEVDPPPIPELEDPENGLKIWLITGKPYSWSNWSWKKTR